MDTCASLVEDLDDKIYNINRDTDHTLSIFDSNRCDYYTENQFMDKIMMKGNLSFILTAEV